MATDLMDTELDQRTAMSLLSALIQGQFQSQMRQQAQQQDPLRQLQMEDARRQMAQRQREQQALELSKARLLGGQGGQGPVGPQQANNPITFGRNPRTGLSSFNNLGYVGGGEEALPENQRAIAARYNQGAMDPSGPPIVNEQGVITKLSNRVPEQPRGSSLEKALMDMQEVKLPGAAQTILAKKMFPELFAGELTDEDKAVRADKRAEARDVRTEQRQEAGSERQLLRELTKSAVQGVDPKKYQAVQKIIAKARAEGMSPEDAAKLARTFGFDYKGAQIGGVRNLFSALGIMDPVSPSSVMLESILPEAIKGLMGGPGSSAPKATTEKPPKPGMVRIKDTKSGRTGWANRGDKLPTGVEFVD